MIYIEASKLRLIVLIGSNADVTARHWLTSDHGANAARGRLGLGGGGASTTHDNTRGNMPRQTLYIGFPHEGQEASPSFGLMAHVSVSQECEEQILEADNDPYMMEVQSSWATIAVRGIPGRPRILICELVKWLY